jgi:hypothetical protein
MPPLLFAGEGNSWTKAQKALRSFSPGNRVNLTVEAPGGAIRYTIAVVDRAERVAKQPLAAFIVPIGREHEWVFAAREGQDQLARDAVGGCL